MTTKTGRKKLNFLNRKGKITDPLDYGHPGIDGPVPADLDDTVRAIEDLTELLNEAQQEGWNDMVDIVKGDLSHWTNAVRYLERAAKQQET